MTVEGLRGTAAEADFYKPAASPIGARGKGLPNQSFAMLLLAWWTRLCADETCPPAHTLARMKFQPGILSSSWVGLSL